MRARDYEQEAARALPEAELHVTDEEMVTADGKRLGIASAIGSGKQSCIVVVNGEPVAWLPFTAFSYEVGIGGPSKLRAEFLAGGAALDSRRARQ